MGVLGHTILGSLGTESLCMRMHRTLVPGCGDTGALALGCGDMWDTEGTSLQHITWRTQSPRLGRTLLWERGTHSGIQRGPPGIIRDPNQSLSVPLCPSQPSPTPFISHFSFCLDFSLCFLHSLWLSPFVPIFLLP